MCEKDFQINNKGWYTYQGRIVLAGATYACLNSRSGGCAKYNTKYDYIKYYNYYDKVNIKIDGVVYPGIILDSCGACMSNRIIDLFVSDGKYEMYRAKVYLEP